MNGNRLLNNPITLWWLRSKLINLRGNSIKKLNIGMNLLNIVPGIIKPPHATVKLGPGGFHLMLVNLKQALKSGETLAMKLKFAKAGEVTVSFPIQPVGSSGPAGGDGMNGMKM